MSPTLVAAALVGGVAVVAGWFVWHSGRARASATCLLLGGAVLLLASAAVVLDLGDAAPPAFRLAACLLLPAAVLAYPRLVWRDPLSLVLVVVVLGSGCLAVVWDAALVPMSYVLVISLLVHAWWAYERGDPDDRRALAWSSLGWIGGALVAGSLGFVSESAGTGGIPELGAVYVSCLAVGPAAMAIGVVRPEVVDVRGTDHPGGRGRDGGDRLRLGGDRSRVVGGRRAG